MQILKLNTKFYLVVVVGELARSIPNLLFPVLQVLWLLEEPVFTCPLLVKVQATGQLGLVLPVLLQMHMELWNFK